MSLRTSREYANEAARELVILVRKDPEALQKRIADVLVGMIHQVKLDTLDAVAERLGVGTRVGK